MMGFREWLCKKIGHSFDRIDLLILSLSVDSHKRFGIPTKLEIKCKRCGEIIDIKEKSKESEV